jgi:hypothetical protein
MIIHAGNTRPHTAKSNDELCAKPDLKVAPHPHHPHSPDLAQSDYSRFSSINDKPKVLSFPLALHLHRAGKQTMQSIDRSMLMATFDQWIARAEQCIQLDGDSFE